ncbi:MAG TPA: hypothetical protein VLQ93_18960 [Myxococcaceae bacterium]|nr:hypothetical protein [Myxococcaceae bacterium]
MLFLLLLAPGVSLATPPGLAPEAGALPALAFPSTEGPGSSRLLMAEPATPSEVRAPAPLPLRLLAELGLGAVVSAGMGLGAGLGTNLLCLDQRGSFGCRLATTFMTGVGYLAGIVPGVLLGGRLTGAYGSPKGAALGALVGLIPGVVMLASDPKPPPDAIVLAAALPLVGAVAGYELSQLWETPAGARRGVQLQPVLAFSANGSILGVGGRF